MTSMYAHATEHAFKDPFLLAIITGLVSITRNSSIKTPEKIEFTIYHYFLSSNVKYNVSEKTSTNNKKCKIKIGHHPVNG